MMLTLLNMKKNPTDAGLSRKSQMRILFYYKSILFSYSFFFNSLKFNDDDLNHAGAELGHAQGQLMLELGLD